MLMYARAVQLYIKVHTYYGHEKKRDVPIHIAHVVTLRKKKNVVCVTLGDLAYCAAAEYYKQALHEPLLLPCCFSL